jgi:prolipoprotein diacylglyceryltransferase
MQQVLFNIPVFKEWFPPDGLPINGFGVMLFITFIACVGFFGRRAARTGTNMPQERVQDLVIFMFVGGLSGARLTYMIQYGIPVTPANFVRIWEGGIVLYGGVLAGVGLFIVAYYGYLRRVGVHFWKLADAVAPTLALGIALGRVGCLLNGCCYGHVAPEGCPQLHFPTLTAPARDTLIDQNQLQTIIGFTTERQGDDVRSVVTAVEPGSAAQREGLQPGDRIINLDGQPNSWVMLVTGPDAMLDTIVKLAEQGGARVADTTREGGGRRLKIVADDVPGFRATRTQIADAVVPGGHIYETDRFTDTIPNWPRAHPSMELEVERGGQTVALARFTPRTIGLHPTQLYETISMLLLMAFLLAYYPFRRHDGQVFVVFVACYAVHRFMNEILRNDTSVVGFQMTLSQNISVMLLTAALGLEVVLRWLRPRVRDGVSPTPTPAA